MGQLRPIVDAENLLGILGRHGSDPQAVGMGVADDIGEVLLALGVVGRQLVQVALQHRRTEGVHPAVDLGDREHLILGVLVLDDGGDVAGLVAHDTAVAGGIVEYRGEHRSGRARLLVALQQVLQGRLRQQRCVAGQHQDRPAALIRRDPLFGQLLQRDAHRVAGAVLLMLDRDHGVRRDGGQVLGHLVAAMPDHDDEVLRLQRPTGGEHVPD